MGDVYVTLRLRAVAESKASVSELEVLADELCVLVNEMEYVAFMASYKGMPNCVVIEISRDAVVQRLRSGATLLLRGNTQESAAERVRELCYKWTIPYSSEEYPCVTCVSTEGKRAAGWSKHFRPGMEKPVSFAVDYFGNEYVSKRSIQEEIGKLYYAADIVEGIKHLIPELPKLDTYRNPEPPLFVDMGGRGGSHCTA